MEVEQIVPQVWLAALLMNHSAGPNSAQRRPTTGGELASGKFMTLKRIVTAVDVAVAASAPANVSLGDKGQLKVSRLDCAQNPPPASCF